MATIDSSCIIREAICQSLETVAFLTVEDSCELSPCMQEDIVVTAIDFTGPVSGRICLWAGMNFAKMFAENFSGETPADQNYCIDGLKELLNVTCGLVLPMVASSPTETFDLTVPRRIAEGKENWQSFAGSDDVTLLEVEGHPIAVKMILR